MNREKLVDALMVETGYEKPVCLQAVSEFLDKFLVIKRALKDEQAVHCSPSGCTFFVLSLSFLFIFMMTIHCHV